MGSIRQLSEIVLNIDGILKSIDVGNGRIQQLLNAAESNATRIQDMEGVDHQLWMGFEDLDSALMTAHVIRLEGIFFQIRARWKEVEEQFDALAGTVQRVLADDRWLLVKAPTHMISTEQYLDRITDALRFYSFQHKVQLEIIKNLRSYDAVSEAVESWKSTKIPDRERLERWFSTARAAHEILTST